MVHYWCRKFSIIIKLIPWFGNRDRQLGDWKVIGLKGKWIKQTLCWFLVFVVLFSAASLIRKKIEQNRPWENPYSDVTDSLWSYGNIKALNQAGVLPSWETLEPAEDETRGKLVLYLYNMDQAVFPEKKKKKEEET